MEYDKKSGLKPEDRTEYYRRRIDEYYEKEGDPVIGRELSVEFFRHADISTDPSTTPLIGRDGEPIQGDEGPLTLADYVNFAAQRHPYALSEILDFLLKRPGTQSYQDAREVILGRFKFGRG